MGKLREVDNEVSTNDPNYDRYNPLKDENPAPTSQTRAEGDGGGGLSFGGTVVDTEPGSSLGTMALKQGEKISKDTREGRGQHADEVEDGVTLLKLETLVPT